MKKDNKGFSLVELIIVIAIMAILVVVVAPQYLKYVEKSRISVDQDNAGEIGRAMQIYAADQGNPSDSDNAIVTVSTSGISVTASSWAAKAMENAGLKAGDAAIKSKNASWKDGYQIKMGTDGALVYYQGTTGTTEFTDIVNSDYAPATGG